MEWAIVILFFLFLIAIVALLWWGERRTEEVLRDFHAKEEARRIDEEWEEFNRRGGQSDG